MEIYISLLIPFNIWTKLIIWNIKQTALESSYMHGAYIKNLSFDILVKIWNIPKFKTNPEKNHCTIRLSETARYLKYSFCYFLYVKTWVFLP